MMILLLIFSTDSNDFWTRGDSRKPTPPTEALTEFLVAEAVMSWYELIYSTLRDSEWCCRCSCMDMISFWCCSADETSSCLRDSGLIVLVLRVLNWNRCFLIMKCGFVPVLLQLSGTTRPEDFEVAPSYTELADTGCKLGARTLVLYSTFILGFCLMAGPCNPSKTATLPE